MNYLWGNQVYKISTFTKIAVPAACDTLSVLCEPNSQETFEWSPFRKKFSCVIGL
jgi:hypothetical protein